jgi:Zn-dependent peptidase ImmA (M78 family)/transcriptional regulator with XRE-family HTH domain
VAGVRNLRLSVLALADRLNTMKRIMPEIPHGTARAIGERIRAMRAARGFSQDQLANKIQRRQATISAWESGRSVPSVEDLYDLAFIFDIDIHELLPGRRLEPPLRGILRAIEEQLPAGTRFHAALEMFLRRAMKAPCPAREIDVEAKNPEAAAADLLAAGGITAPPVDVDRLAARCGSRVVAWDTNEEAVSGLLIELEDGPLIAYNANHPQGRKRFTVAHELGHLLMDHLDSFHVDLTVREGAEGRPGYDPSKEKQANEFAANLLMPAEWVRRHLEGGPSLKAVANDVFEVSELAFGYRLMALGIDLPHAEDELLGPARMAAAEEKPGR